MATAVASLAGVPPAAAAESAWAWLSGGSDTVAPDALAYQLTLDVDAPDSGELKTLIASVARLAIEEPRGASDAYALVARARGDRAQIEASLYSEGFYAGSIAIRIAGQDLERLDPAALAAPEDAKMAVAVTVKAGPRFTFGNVVLVQRSHHGEGPSLAPADLGLASGSIARSGNVVAASEKLVEAWRAAGFPLARVVDREVIADHARTALDVRFDIDPGPPAVYGWVGVMGAPNIDHGTLLEQSKLEPGRAFRPKDIKQARDRLAKLPGVESVRVVEGQELDANGGLPVYFDVTERKPRYFGATASLSTTDGAEIEAHWGHRNIFGAGEHLRFEGSVSRIGSEDLEQLEFDAGAILTKPGILDADTDLVSEFRLSREHPDAYESFEVMGKVGVAHVFTPALSGTAAVTTQFADVEDAFGDHRYLLVSLPLEAAYDTRDQRLDPTSGVSVLASLSPTIDTIGGAAFAASQAQIASFASFDGTGNTVFAARVGAGSIAGASLADVPASTRFFGGGGGSVRGYEYRSIGPIQRGKVVGGLGYVGASAELRQRLFRSFGIVAFVDAISVSEEPYPFASDLVYIGAGAGVRYYTALGPLRIDVATPVNRREGQAPVAVYVGLGQAF